MKYLKTSLKNGSAAFMEHGIIINYLTDDDDVHMTNPENQNWATPCRQCS